MTEAEANAFKAYVAEQRRLNSRKRLPLEVIKNLEEADLMCLQINAEIDAPLPNWAKEVLDKKNSLSRRNRIMLLRYHDYKIREHRLRMAKGLV